MERAFLPVYVGRYLRKTRRFKAIHHGAYTMLLYTLWEEGGSLPYDLDELRELACVDRRSWPSVWKVIGPFFTIHDGRISQHTMTEVLEDFDAKRRSHVEGGKRSGAKHAEKMRQIKARDRGQPEDSSSSKAKGFASPSYEGERQSLALDSRMKFAQMLCGQYLDRRCKQESLRAVQDALAEHDGNIFRVSEPCSDARDWETIRRYLADVCRVRLELTEQRVLSFPLGGAR
ncbi:DUF1376 domain-containing protein [Acidiphilium sp.]|uniref:DUF1376 domain-containing protein n=1 Tax=Acidiphilium sp. TaxID=527 RepID=UPI00258D9103|nr:DUF1376 domain-containing protein [Acidiphilium sp.]